MCTDFLKEYLKMNIFKYAYKPVIEDETYYSYNVNNEVLLFHAV